MHLTSFLLCASCTSRLLYCVPNLSHIVSIMCPCTLHLVYCVPRVFHIFFLLCVCSLYLSFSTVCPMYLRYLLLCDTYISCHFYCVSDVPVIFTTVWHIYLMPFLLCALCTSNLYWSVVNVLLIYIVSHVDISKNQEWTIQRHWQYWVHKTHDEEKHSKTKARKHKTENKSEVLCHFVKIVSYNLCILARQLP